ncbi:MAG TPA: phage baseplate assembly protein V [Flavobacterium sp.]|jgi:phage baseplate assembly protein V
MPISTQIDIRIAGEPLRRFSKLVINQKVHAHHRFSLLQPLPKEFVEQAIDKAQKYVGQSIHIEIKPNNTTTDAPLLFNGIITETQIARTAGASGGIIINGYSPTIILEGTPHTRSFSNSTLVNIVNEVVKNYPKDTLKPSVEVQKDSSLSYTVQYAESDFSFLCRIAQKKGQWFYYNGEELRFGKPTSKTFTLEYGRTLHSFNIEMRAKSLAFEYLGYDPSNGDTQKASSLEIDFQAQGYSKAMFDSSNKLFPTESTMLYSHALEEGNSRSHLVERVTTQLQSRSADLVTVKGDCDETGIRIGDVIVIKEPSFSLTGNVIDGLQEQNFGSYIVTDIMHICDESGNYHNTFDAVPDTVMSPPYGNVHSFPSADSQPATVVANNDPAGLGRVQVAFAWQTASGTNTPWVRMVNPHTGGGKGFYFVPEVGEEVLVAFEGGNAEKPFVLGSMYSGAASSGYADESNTVKAIHTRSGHIIKFTEDQSIVITDKSGNAIVLDTTGKNINITAPETVTISAKNIQLNADESITSSAGKNISATAAGDIVHSASGNINELSDSRTEIVEKDYIRTSATSVEIAEEVTLNSTKENILMQSAKTVAFNSGEKSNIF